MYPIEGIGSYSISSRIKKIDHESMVYNFQTNEFTKNYLTIEWSRCWILDVSPPGRFIIVHHHHYHLYYCIILTPGLPSGMLNVHPSYGSPPGNSPLGIFTP